MEGVRARVEGGRQSPTPAPHPSYLFIWGKWGRLGLASGIRQPSPVLFVFDGTAPLVPEGESNIWGSHVSEIGSSRRARGNFGVGRAAAAPGYR